MSSVPARRLFTTLQERIAPEHTAVIVVDMQNDYVSIGGAGHRRHGSVDAAQSIIPALQELLRAATRVGTLVVYIQMTMDRDLRLVSDPEYLRRRAVWGDLAVVEKGTWGHEIIPELAPEPGDLLVEKHRRSAFAGTTLDQILRSNHIASTIVTGVVTHGCVDSTVRDAMLRDYYVTLVRDCVSSAAQDLHDATLFLLERIMPLENSIVTTRQIVEQWATLPAVGAPAALAQPMTA
jgi:ureidoacrylate peracid hydrolase